MKDDLNKMFPNDALTLEHLSEEASEIIKAKSKIIRFGLQDRWPVESGDTNIAKLEEEIGHLEAVVDVLVQRGILSRTNIEKAKPEKWESMQKWNGYRGTKGEIS